MPDTLKCANDAPCPSVEACTAIAFCQRLIRVNRHAHVSDIPARDRVINRVEARGLATSLFNVSGPPPASSGWLGPVCWVVIASATVVLVVYAIELVRT